MSTLEKKARQVSQLRVQVRTGDLSTQESRSRRLLRAELDLAQSMKRLRDSLEPRASQILDSTTRILARAKERAKRLQ